MKKLGIIVGLWVCLFLVSLVNIDSFFNQNQIQKNENTEFEIKLMHNETKVFNVDYFNVTNSQYINTENNNTVQSLNGLYDALYSFSNDANDAPPTVGNPNNILVRSEIMNHSKVIQMSDPSLSSLLFFPYPEMEEGIIEMWLYLYANNSIANSEFIVQLLETSSVGVEVHFRTGTYQRGIYVCNYTDSGTFISSFAFEEWLHFKVTFNCTSKLFWIYLNNDTALGGDLQFNGIPPRANITNRISIYSSGFAYLYLDALDFSNDEDYIEGRNEENQYYPAGSYTLYNISFPTMFVYNITTYCNILLETDLTLEIWIPYGIYHVWFPVVLNYSINAFFPADTIHFRYNFSSDGLNTSELFGFTVYYNETILNELPSIGNINSIKISVLNYNISCFVFDPDLDLINLTLRNATNDDIIQSWINVENGSLCFYEIVLLDCATEYIFYFEVNDLENITSSENFNFTTESCLEPPGYQFEFDLITDCLVVGVIIMVSSLIVIGLKKSKQIKHKKRR